VPERCRHPGASLDVEQKVRSDAKGTVTTREAKSKNKFTGTVGTDAFLSSVQQSFHEESSWQLTTGSGAYNVDVGMTYTANQSGSFLGGAQSGSASGSVGSASGQATEGNTLARSAGFSMAVDALTLEDAYQAAQRLWRQGRCVMVEAPDYGAATPIETAQQEAKQHDEKVDVDSETQFSVRLKHRFAGGTLSLPLKADLTSGDKTLEPNQLDSGSGPLKYKAPPEEDKHATATLRTTSKRGIGTLVLDFHTGGALTLTVTGTMRGTTNMFGVSSEATDTVTVGPIRFKKMFENVYQGTGDWQAQHSERTTGFGRTVNCSMSQRGKITWLAELVKRGDKNVWVLDGNDAMAEGNSTMECDGATTDIGESAGLFLGVLGQFTIPEEGGRIPVSGSMPTDRGTTTASGTAVAETGKK
jgi:hypothetical protein